MTRPYFSRCAIGRNKWFWVTYPNFDAICHSPVDGAVEASGIATSAMEAEEQARAAIQEKHGDAAPKQLQTYFASGVHHRQTIRRRASQPNKAENTGAREVEYLYTDYEGDYSEGSLKHRILKKTAKRVYVARYSVTDCQEDDKWEEDGQVFHDVRTVVLDRQQLETEGCATSKRHWNMFYTTPREERIQPATPRCLAVLGLKRGADRESINGAYRRLAMRHHPDQGGDAEDFKRVQEAYEMAISSLA